MEQYIVFKQSICQYAVPVKARDATDAIRKAFQEDEYDREDHVGMYTPSDWGVWNHDLKQVKAERDKLQDLNGKAYVLFHQERRRQNAQKNFPPGWIRFGQGERPQEQWKSASYQLVDE